MSERRLAKIEAETAAEAAPKAPMGEEAATLRADGAEPATFLDGLMERGLYSDAVQFLAHALPRRDAIWWACLCARARLGNAPTAERLAALEAAERWVAEPGEDNRRAAQRASEAAELGNACGCAALAVFLSGGSLAPPGQPEVPPADHLAAHAVAGSVILGAVTEQPEHAPKTLREFLALGIEVAEGRRPWPEPAPAPAARRSPAPPPSRLAAAPVERRPAPNPAPRRRDTWE